MPGQIESSNTSNIFIRGDSIYTIVDGPSWTEAEANAKKLGGHLVTINDAEENDFITKSFHSDFIDAQYQWIGLNDSINEGKWEWSSSEENLFSNLSGSLDKFSTHARTIREGGSWSSITEEEALKKIEDYVYFINLSHNNWGIPNNYDSFFESGSVNNGGWGWITTSTRKEVNLDYVVMDIANDSQKKGAWFVDKQNNQDTGIAETPFIRRGDSAYVIVEGPTWEEAEANANKLGGHLVTINDQDENDWLVETFKDSNLSPYFF